MSDDLPNYLKFVSWLNIPNILIHLFKILKPFFKLILAIGIFLFGDWEIDGRMWKLQGGIGIKTELDAKEKILREELEKMGISGVRILPQSPEHKRFHIYSSYDEEITAENLLKNIPSKILEHMDDKDARIELFSVAVAYGTIRIKYLFWSEAK